MLNETGLRIVAANQAEHDAVRQTVAQHREPSGGAPRAGGMTPAEEAKLLEEKYRGDGRRWLEEVTGAG